MKLTKADKKHVLYGLAIFIFVWIVASFFHKNGLWFGLLATTIAASLKELNDHFGFIKSLLSDGETKTGFNGRDWWLTVAIPFTITCIVYALNLV